ncbi:MAG: F-type H+-transporting ATPase subunit delta [Chloroflexota bacterium]|nr:F-type H+-transporting ATPase subunit delta [Chloroflexota bacterium]
MDAPDRVSSYAQAFYEAALERWLAALAGTAAKLAAEPATLARAQAVGADFALRQPILDQLLPAEVDLPVRNLIYTLAQRGDLALLADIAVALRERMRRTAAEPVTAEIISAVPLTDAERQTLVAGLEAQYGAGLVARYQVDPAILGGLIVRVGDKLIDGSVASRLAAMKQALGVTGE